MLLTFSTMEVSSANPVILDKRRLSSTKLADPDGPSVYPNTQLLCHTAATVLKCNLETPHYRECGECKCKKR